MGFDPRQRKADDLKAVPIDKTDHLAVTKNGETVTFTITDISEPDDDGVIEVKLMPKD